MSHVPKLRVTVHAGPHARENTACSVALPPGVELPLSVDLVAGKTRLSAQVVTCGEQRSIVFLVDRLGAGKSRSYDVLPAEGPAPPGVRIAERKTSLGVRVLGDDFTSYVFAGPDCPARPYLYPVLGPNGVPLTRRMEKRGTPGYDHPHHRSIWVAHGLVNGTDNWSEEPGHGRTVHQEFVEIVSGPVAGGATEQCVWTSASGAKILDETRAIRIYAQPQAARCIDIQFTFRTGHDAVLFGDTKEGGLLSVRVNPVIDAPAGTITNSYGGTNEDETWGKRASWCDYSGVIEGTPAGIAVFDHPANYGYPVYWHVRNYGLMTANPFGLSYFEPDSGKRGEWVLGAHSEAAFSYRVLVHGGDAASAKVAERYHDFVNPPRCELA